MPWTVNAEMFPSEARILSSPIAFVFNWSCAVAVPFVSPLLEELMDVGSPYPVYLCFALLCLMGAVFVMIFMPETRGRTPEEIANLFAKKENKLSVKNTGEDNLAYVN